MRRACAALGDPQDRLVAPIHVAGTNGKGSTVEMMRACAAAAGLRVVAYSSPADSLTEQIALPGGPPDKSAVADALAQIDAAAPDLSTFERETAAAFVIMAQTPHDLALVEVGMGGDDDATNVLSSCAAAAITPVALDHQAFLGNDVATIARRKAGIAKPGRPLVLAAQAPAAEAAILETAQALGAAPILRHGVDWSVGAGKDGFRFSFQGEEFVCPQPSLRGPHQLRNAGLALAVARVIGLPISPDAIADADLPLRFEPVEAAAFGLPAHWRAFRDGAHNPHAARALAATIAEERNPDERIVLVLAMRADKDVDGFLAAFRDLAPLILPARRSGDDPDALIATAAAQGFSILPASDEDGALAVICGSLAAISPA